MEFELDVAPSDESINEIRNGLVEHNQPFLNGLDREKVAFYAKVNEKKVGGITAEVFGNWLLINFLWVEESIRGKDVGSNLLLQLENHAKSKGCHSSMVDTFSFQAKPFYEKHGYVCHMTLENYPVDHARHFFTKLL
ncbi:GNAT family N-acetyltransferase [Photobacterium alginatilyticum]|uniref:GNAT family N-acetyltransferase n=1 Tax=Photobacterium alginatilyticum TaxID=1775171 RepID=A0ABW9YQC5_9GAMM|nr:GNAT family N-acetyltransferase [Photobacterium alginatilyticum]NBI55600.1 GNAT family N-acetyltransferase [Photobacterium alginatilyticum]